MNGYMGRHHEQINAVTRARVAQWVADADSSDAGSRAARTSSPNLESSTLDSSLPGYSVTILDFGDGVVESRAVFVDRRKRLKSPQKERAPVPPEIAEMRRREKLEWSRQRAVRSLRWRCMALKADHMFTFTKRGKFASLDDVRETWSRFWSLLQKIPNLDFRYVAVPELHGDGETWHLHVAVCGFYSVSFIRKLWYRALGGRGDEKGQETPGSVNARYFSSARKGALVVAAYMSKYMGKSFSASGSGRKAFWSSRGLVPRLIQKVFEPVGDDVMLRVRDRVAPMAPKSTLWRVFEWEYVGLHGFVMKTY